jgi:uncharacterized integral membrane protein
MRIVRQLLAVILAILFMAPTAGAQDHVIGKSALDQAVQQRISRERADREMILSLLERQDIRDIAGKAGLSIEKARAGVSMLQGNDLELAAQQARVVQDNLAGGGNITVSTTTIIIVLLLLILILVIAN